jgi:hypothetical protein
MLSEEGIKEKVRFAEEVGKVFVPFTVRAGTAFGIGAGLVALGLISPVCDVQSCLLNCLAGHPD